LFGRKLFCRLKAAGHECDEYRHSAQQSGCLGTLSVRFTINSLRISHADRHSTQACPISEGLPISGTFAIEAKLGPILDDSEFLGKPIEKHQNDTFFSVPVNATELS
jgi:hypothetical protein